MVTICSDECLHLWEISNRDGLSHLEHVRSLSLESKYAVYLTLIRVNDKCAFMCNRPNCFVQ